MDHVTLEPYPFPEGMAIPRLMPYQEYPWNGDGYLAAEVLRLKAAHNLDNAFETGTCLGSTALWLWENFRHTRTVELHRPYFDLAVSRITMHVERFIRDDIGTSDVWFGGHGVPGDPSSGQIVFQSSEKAIARYGKSLKWDEEEGRRTFFFSDAHWNEHCPLLDELTAIAEADIKPCLVIHDLQVPGTDFGFDSMPDGRPFNLELITPYLDRIYGEGKYKTNYPTQVEGARRGWISIEPCQ